MTRSQPYFRRGIICITLSLLIGMALPALLAYFDGVYYFDRNGESTNKLSASLEQKLPDIAKKQLISYRERRQTFKEIIATTERSLKNPNQPLATLKDILEVRQRAEDALGKTKPGVTISGFASNQTTYYFTCSFLSLTFLAYILFPRSIVRPSVRGVLEVGIVYIILAGLNWVRNLLPHDPSRKVFSFVNSDISLVSFLGQEMRLLLLAFLLWLCARQWAAFADLVEEDTTSWDECPALIEEFSARASKTSLVVNHWQIASLLLALALLPWTMFYWYSVRVLEDNRYMLSSLVFHAIWIGVWAVMSRSAYVVTRQWQKYRMACLLTLRNEPESEAHESLEKLITETKPVTNLQVIGAAVGIVGSIIYPIVQLAR